MSVMVAVVMLGFGPTVSPADAAVTARLPDLAVLAPFDFRIEISSAGKRLLRFSTVIVNIGAGPFQLYGYDEDGVAAIGDSLLVRQQILQSDGTFRERNTTATLVWASDGHNHFHALDLQRIELQTLRADTLLRSAKRGFCFLDSYEYRSTKPSRYNSANDVCQVAPSKTVPMGVSVGWGDVYKSTIALQWIDITGLPNGDYRIRIIADPLPRTDRHRRARGWETGGRFLESNESNNRGWATIRLTRTTVTVLTKSARP